MGVNSLPKTVTEQRRDCDWYPGPSAPESSTLTTRLPSSANKCEIKCFSRRLFYFISFHFIAHVRRW